MIMITALFFLASLVADIFMPEQYQDINTTTNQNIYLPIVTKSGSPDASIVMNGDFESGRTGWIEYENSIFFNFPLIVPENDLPTLIKPYNGSWVAWLGGDSELITYIEQEITIPESASQLIYWHWIDSISACDSSFGGVYLNSISVDQYLLCQATAIPGWEKRTINLSPYAGQTVTLRIMAQTGVNNYSSLYIDAISVEKSP